MRVTLDCFCFIQVPDTALQCNVSIYGEECVRCAKNLITEGCTDNCSVVLVDSVGDPNYRINGEMGWGGMGEGRSFLHLRRWKLEVE